MVMYTGRIVGPEGCVEKRVLDQQVGNRGLWTAQGDGRVAAGATLLSAVERTSNRGERRKDRRRSERKGGGGEEERR